MSVVPLMPGFGSLRMVTPCPSSDHGSRAHADFLHQTDVSILPLQRNSSSLTFSKRYPVPPLDFLPFYQLLRLSIRLIASHQSQLWPAAVLSCDNALWSLVLTSSN